MFSEVDDPVSPDEFDISLSDCFFGVATVVDDSVWNFIPLVDVCCGFPPVRFPVSFAFRLIGFSCNSFRVSFTGRRVVSSRNMRCCGE